MVRSFKEDSYNFVGPVRARTGHELLKGFRDLQAKEHELGLPIFAHHGNADKITSLSVRWAALHVLGLTADFAAALGTAKPCKTAPAVTA